ncbi:hypothetical protein B0H19DRAFT_1373239 [Mycena capillaripes]|nr:hypothetical protein B0H19DRAFT_1373239 [Mycena capillaripes]
MSRAPPPAYTWNWGIPGLQLDPPPMAQGADPTADPPNFQDLKFNPIGLYDLRRRLGVLHRQPGIFTTFRAKFDAADLAWLAAGASDDGQHGVPLETFFPAFHTLRKSLPPASVGREQRTLFSNRIQKVIFDLATMWDRAMGGTTLVLHIDGTTVPNTVLTPDRLKASVHAPPHFLQENPDSHLAIAHIVQLFIEYVGIPTVDRWTRSARRLWPMQSNTDGQASHPPSTRLIPTPQPPGSSHYLFYGRPWANLPVLSTLQPPLARNNSPVPAVSQVLTDEYDDSTDVENLDDTAVAVMELSEQVYTLTVDLETSQRIAQDRLDVIFQCGEQQQRLWEHEQELEEQVRQLKEQLRVLSFRPAPSTPLAPLATPSSVHSPPSTPTRRVATSTSTSSRLRTVVRSPTPISSGRSFPLSPPRVTELPSGLRSLGSATQAYLRDNQLEYLRAGLEIVVRQVQPVRYYEEVNRLGLEGDVADELLAAMGYDA